MSRFDSEGLPTSGGSMSGDLDMGSNDITNVGSLDAATIRSGRATFAVSTNTAALGAADVYACTDTSAARTLTISTATIAEGTPTRPRVITVTDDSGGAGTNNITIDTEGAQTIDGAASSVIMVGYGTVALLSDGSTLTSIGGGSGRINAFDRAPLTSDPRTVVDVYSVDNLPDAIVAPDGVSRVPLGPGVQYVVHRSFVWPRLMIPIGEGVVESTEIVGQRFPTLVLISGDTVPHIWGRNIGNVMLRNIAFADVSNLGVGRGSVIFDLAGGSSNATVAFDALAFFGLLRIGDFLDLILTFQSPIGFVNIAGGIVVAFTGVFTYSGFPVIGPTFETSVVDKPMLSLVGPAIDTGVNLSSGSFSLATGDPGMYVDPTFTGSLSMVGMGYGGTLKGDFFREDVNLGITGEVAADKPISSFSADIRAISFVVPAAVGVTFDAGRRHNWRVGDTVTHTGFATPGYNGVITITSITPFTYSATAVPFVIDDSGTATHDVSTLVTFAGQGMYRGQTVLLGGATPGAYAGLRVIQAVEDDENGFTIAVAFGPGGTGTIQITRVTTASDHPMVRGETHTIAGTAAYNGTRRILSLPADNQFDISHAWVSNEGAVGTVASATLDETDLNINAVGNGAQKDSKSIGSVGAAGNTVATDMAAGPSAWTDLDLDGLAVAGPNIERWGSVNATTGEVTYLGIAMFSGNLVATMSSTSAGGSQRFQFRAVIDGSPVAGAVPSSVDLSSSPMIPIPLLQPIQCETGQTVRIQVQNTDGTSDILIQDLVILIS